VIHYGPPGAGRRAPGVGKLSVAREPTAPTGFKLVHTHLASDLVGAVFPRRSEPWVRRRHRSW
jgi:hypothetical protein